MSYYFGWQRDLPDVRDLTDNHDKVNAVLKTAPIGTAPASVDLR